MPGYLRIILTARIRDERGASAVEYGLLVAGVAVMCIAVLQSLGFVVGQVFSSVNDSITTGP